MNSFGSLVRADGNTQGVNGLLSVWLRSTHILSSSSQVRKTSLVNPSESFFSIARHAFAYLREYLTDRGYVSVLSLLWPQTQPPSTPQCLPRRRKAAAFPSATPRAASKTEATEPLTQSHNTKKKHQRTSRCSQKQCAFNMQTDALSPSLTSRRPQNTSNYPQHSRPPLKPNVKAHPSSPPPSAPHSAQ